MVELFDCTNISLKEGDKGEKVSLLQTHLKTLGYYTYYNGSYLKIDGDFGKYTTLAVKAFQKDTGHTQDGWFGPKTCPSLNEKIGGKSSTSTSTTTTTTTSTGSVKSGASAKDPYKADTTKNIMKQSESNISIDGIFLSATITPNVSFWNGNWKYLEMMDGSVQPYRGHRQPLEYTVEFNLYENEFKQLHNEIYKMANRKCNVLSKHLNSGYYSIEASYAEGYGQTKNVTLKLKSWNTK